MAQRGNKFDIIEAQKKIKCQGVQEMVNKQKSGTRSEHWAGSRGKETNTTVPSPQETHTLFPCPPIDSNKKWHYRSPVGTYGTLSVLTITLNDQLWWEYFTVNHQ